MKQKQTRKAEHIARDIVDLTESLDSQQELKKTWRVLDQALRYLSDKDNYLTSKVRTEKLIAEMEYAS